MPDGRIVVALFIVLASRSMGLCRELVMLGGDSVRFVHVRVSCYSLCTMLPIHPALRYESLRHTKIGELRAPTTA